MKIYKLTKNLIYLPKLKNKLIIHLFNFNENENKRVRGRPRQTQARLVEFIY
jgi:hypothetical protein